MLNHKRFIIPLQEKNVILQLASIFLVRVLRNILIPSVKMTLTSNKMFAGIICQTIEREADYSTAKKFLFWLLFSMVNLFSILKIRFIPQFDQISHNCSFICRYSPCCKPNKLGHYSVLWPGILRLLLTLYGKMT